MMSYRMPLSARSRKAGRFIAKVHREIQNAFVQSNMKQQELADKLGVDRSIINRRLLGEANLTLRSIADLAWALEKEISFSLTAPNSTQLINEYIPRAKTVSEHKSVFSNLTSTSSNSTQTKVGNRLVDA